MVFVTSHPEGAEILGSFRLFLAGLVVLSHAGGLICGYNPGVVAIVSFFLLSGYVMTMLIDRHYASFDRILDFYKDRAARIYPQFLFYLLATLVLIGCWGVTTSFTAGCDPFKTALNALILPLGYFYGVRGCLLVPQAWSLGLEMTFYIIIPVIIFFPKTIGWLTAGSIFVFSLALFGLINTELYGYRLLPGTLFIFLIGFAFARDGAWRHFPWLVWTAALALFVYLNMTPHLLSLSYSKEVLLGLLAGIPALAILRLTQFSRVDEMLGNLSYGVFLNHYFCIWALEAAGYQIANVREWILLFAFSITLALVTYYAIEVPALRWRRKVRYKSSVNVKVLAST